MEKRTLGRTGLNVAVVGFGALPMGGFYGPVDDAVSMQALHAAIDAGMNFIDTSDAYGAGHSERVVGAFLKERPDRDQILIRGVETLQHSLLLGRQIRNHPVEKQ